jgi:acyl carrier protein
MSKLYNLISKTLNIDVSLVSDQSSPGSIENWDSFNGLVLVDELEKSYNVSFTMDEIMDVKTVADIKRHLTNHGVNPDE